MTYLQDPYEPPAAQKSRRSGWWLATCSLLGLAALLAVLFLSARDVSINRSRNSKALMNYQFEAPRSALESSVLSGTEDR